MCRETCSDQQSGFKVPVFGKIFKILLVKKKVDHWTEQNVRRQKGKQEGAVLWIPTFDWEWRSKWNQN